ncbi:Putative insecticidal toxin complex [Pseudomonas chlororaphis]|uniref:Insecticidal toxin complex n=1 Tax=Pseudomonas chlororaphis TaxID=587753 RepID=A0A3G7TPA4_9PSED|nr:RHS repeat-associated core domain-containing protein [Pseudomonas chlororaphis]AZE48348.1 Putative insecticidal toxin complex [Pseudomonas chlororaphis]
MNIPDIARICHGTPTFQVMGNRGQMIRSLNYNRTPDAPNVLDEYITRQVVNARGFTVSQIDPRLFHERSEQPNFTYQVSLSGQLLCSDSVDAGRQYLLPDAEGRAYWMQDGRGTRRQFSYDLLGRPVSKVEQAAGQVAHLSERWIYGSRNVSSANNLRGQLLEQQDPAGVQRTAGYSLHGQPLSLARQLLKSIEPINDWSADPLLGSQVHTTHWQYTALGEHQVQVDAQGNAQQSVYDVAGQLSACLLKPSGQTQALALQLVEYTASGQKRRTKQGNGVVTEYVYAPETQRLRQVTSRRPAKNGRPVLLQDLAYEYDPVGNILSVTDHSKDVRYFANQIVAPVSRYGYDALYQLASASGRESAGLQDRGAQLPDWQHFPKDAGQLLNYSETYTYDRSGNLIDLEHIGAARYHRKMVVSTTANRAFPSTQKQPLQASDVPGYFDPCGNLKQLSQGRSSLQWDARNQLQQVTLVQRNEEHDLETYQYGGDGQRVRKQRQRLTSGTRRREEVIYLPGLELRTHYVNDQAEETLAVISVGSVRLLHWDTPPAGMKNDALHYSLDNHLGSSVMELDGQADLITAEEYYPFGGTACWLARSKVEAGYKTVRYSGKERDETGLYYYGYRYYAPWLGRWINPDPAGTVDGLNLYRMVRNNPIALFDSDGLAPVDEKPMTVAERMKLFSTPAPQAAAQSVSPRRLTPVLAPKPSIETKPLVLTPALPSSGQAANAGGTPPKELKLSAPQQRTTSAEVVTASTTQPRTKFTRPLYRADHRTYEDLQENYSEGFKAWVPLDTEQARKFVNFFVGGRDTSGLPKDLIGDIEALGKKPRLRDLSSYIKYKKDHSTVWVSTAINTAAGGQSSDAQLYEISMELNEFKIGRGGLEALTGGRSSNTEPSLLLDGSTIDDSKIIALNHGPTEDAEISFLTPIPMKNIKPYKGGS